MAISNEERIARLEGGHTNTWRRKSDIAEIRGEMATKSDLAAAQADTNRRIDRLFWAVIGIGGGLTGCCRRRPDSGCAGLTPEEMVVKTL